MVEESKSELLLSLDPGFVRVGIAILDIKNLRVFHHSNRAFVQKQKTKESQVQQTINLYNSINQIIAGLFRDFPDIKYVLVEQQIGKFASVIVQSHLITAAAAFLPSAQIFTISPKMKLSPANRYLEHDKENIQPADSGSKYRNNKRESLRQTDAFLKTAGQLELVGRITTDESDAILQAIYFIHHRL